MAVADYFRQVVTLLYKDSILIKKSWFLTICRLLFPLLSVFVVLIFVSADPFSDIETDPVTGPKLGYIPNCSKYTPKEYLPCITLLWTSSWYTSNNASSFPVAEALMKYLCDANHPPLVYGTDVAFSKNQSSYLASVGLDNIKPNSTYGIINFSNIFATNGIDYQIEYDIYFNSTYTRYQTMLSQTKDIPISDFRYDMINLIQRSIVAFFANNETYVANTTVPTSYKVTVSEMPDPIGVANSSEIAWSIAINFLYIGVSFTIMIELVFIVTEKEKGLRGQMIISGLIDFAYWTAVTIRQSIIGYSSVLLMVIIGWSIPKMTLFHEANIVVVFIIFASFVWNVNCTVVFVSTFIGSRKAANILVCLLFGIGLFLGVGVMTFTDVYFYEVFDIRILGRLLQIFPPLAFGILMLDLKVLTIGPNVSSDDCFALTPNGFSFSEYFNFPDLSEPGTMYCPSVPSSFETTLWLVVEGLILLFLAFYFDAVLPDKHKATLPAFFFLSPTYYRSRNIQVDEYSFENPEIPALNVQHLTKTYKKGRFSSEGITALRPFQLFSPNSTILCMLGPNGAGKSTTISCLTGLTPPSEGDAYVFGYSIATQMNAIRKFMGVCPQFDVLWDELSAWHHMKIFNGLKPSGQRMSNDELMQRLIDVRLADVAHSNAGTFSGGMKRRLSVILATIGDPKVLFLDEPTTGMDPDNRRYVWDLIRKIKDKKLVILTTHSMEEADLLGDRIAIIAQGKLRVEGTPLDLKARFGLGYRVSLSTGVERVDQLKSLVRRILPGAQLRSDNAGALVYSLPDVDPDQSVANFFEYLQENSQRPDRLVDDWGIHNTTMEDVFLTVARKIMGQDITFTGDSKKTQLDHDDREMFKETTKRFEQRFRFLQSEVVALRELLNHHGIDSSHISSAFEEEQKVLGNN